MMYYLIISILR